MLRSLCRLKIKLSSLRTFSTSSNGYNFDFTEDQKNLQDLARRFTKDEIVPVAADYDRTGEYPWPVLKKAWSLGLLTAHIPSEYGGLSLGCFDSVIVTEETCYGCSGISTIFDSSKLGQTPVIIAGNEEQKKKYLGRLVEEPLVVSYAVTEPGTGSDVSAVTTKAVKKGSEWILNGEKMWISNAGHANWFFVLARTNSDPKAPAHSSLTAFIVERDWDGVTPGRKERNLGQRASDNRGVTFDDVRIPAENVLLTEGQGFKIAMKAFDTSRPLVAAGAVGVAQRCKDEAVKYALERNAFGSAISDHQAIAFKLAEMAIGIETARLAYQKAAWQIDNGIKNTYLASIAKVYSSEVANWCATQAVQIFGGAGYNSEYPVEKLFRDAKISEIIEGTSEIQRRIISRIVLDAQTATTRK